jgi:hypothetical protein
MNKDLEKFSIIANRIIYWTTRDEYGTSRSRGVGTLSELADELNSEGILASRGNWTENALKLYIHRLKGRYTLEELAEVCDLDFIEANSWEYASRTHHGEIVKKGKSTGIWNTGTVTKSYPLRTYEPVEGEAWKEHELDDLIYEDKKIVLKSKINTRQ